MIPQQNLLPKSNSNLSIQTRYFIALTAHQIVLEQYDYVFPTLACKFGEQYFQPNQQLQIRVSVNSTQCPQKQKNEDESNFFDSLDICKLPFKRQLRQQLQNHSSKSLDPKRKRRRADRSHNRNIDHCLFALGIVLLRLAVFQKEIAKIGKLDKRL